MASGWHLYGELKCWFLSSDLKDENQWPKHDVGRAAGGCGARQWGCVGGSRLWCGVWVWAPGPWQDWEVSKQRNGETGSVAPEPSCGSKDGNLLNLGL